MTADNLTRNLPGAASAASAHALMHAELSTAARLGHVVLLLVGAVTAIAVGSLWATEPSLPPRTHLAFGALTLIGVAWAVYATWVLTTRRVLLGRHRVVAGRMAVTFTGALVAGSLLVATTTGHPAGYAAAGLGVVMLGVATWLLVRARREVARLAARREEIERALRGGVQVR
ncbi:MAG: hypothetical protein IT183_13410 [Acidobacteria bacterium]|nr:hypothetical protein [Acidobacteriota bacterium]